MSVLQLLLIKTKKKEGFQANANNQTDSGSRCMFNADLYLVFKSQEEEMTYMQMSIRMYEI